MFIILTFKALGNLLPHPYTPSRFRSFIIFWLPQTFDFSCSSVLVLDFRKTIISSWFLLSRKKSVSQVHTISHLWLCIHRLSFSSTTPSFTALPYTSLCDSPCFESFSPRLERCSTVRRTCRSCRRPRFNSQHPRQAACNHPCLQLQEIRTVFQPRWALLYTRYIYTHSGIYTST